MIAQIKVNRIASTMLDKLSDICEWELDGDNVMEDSYEFNTTHTELMHRVISKMYIDYNFNKLK